MPDKPAPVDHPVLSVVTERWSPRSYADRPVERDKLLTVLEAGRWAASCFNWQPWHYLIATRDEPAEFERMLSCLIPWNQSWVRTAPVVLLTFASNKVPGKDDPNPHGWHDVGLASAQMALQAQALGLQAHIMSGIEADKIRETYAIPADFDPVTAITLGYVGAPEALPEKLAAREHDSRERRPLNAFVFSGAWGRAAPFLTE